MDQDLKQLNKRFDTLATFIRENMVTKLELQGLREEVATKTDIGRLETSMDAIAKLQKDTNQEVSALHHRMNQMEHWVKSAASKIGVEYKP